MKMQTEVSFRTSAIEKSVYEKLLSNPDEVVEGTVKELAERFDIELMAMVGFLDGINESLVEENDLEDLSEDSHVSLAFDKEKLYKNMVDAKADWLYELPQWDKIFDKEIKTVIHRAEEIRYCCKSCKSISERSVSMRKRQKI